MGFKERMQGDPDEWYYTVAWGLLRKSCSFDKIKDMPKDFLNKTLSALEVIRTNRPEYREVFIKGVDDAVTAPTDENNRQSKA